ncbi:MAG: LicD family protein [Erysipelotrichaceae bacterium]
MEKEYEKYVLKTNKDGSKIYVRDLQLALLDILKDIDKVCQENDIPYFLTGGSCLGAVRHEGFIPWDDDADIGIMASDFPKFEEIIRKNLSKEYYVQSLLTHKEFNVLTPAIKIRRKNTYCTEPTLLKNRCKDNEGDRGDGIFIDVFVIDYVDPSLKRDLPRRILSYLFCPPLVILDNLHIDAKFLKKAFVNNAHKAGKNAKKNNSKYIGYDITWIWNLKRIMYPYDSVFPTKYVKFEDTMLPIPNNPKILLDIEIAPSHMSYPPIKDRTPKHIKDINLKSNKPSID